MIDRTYLNFLLQPYCTQVVCGLKPDWDLDEILAVLLRDGVDMSTALWLAIERGASTQTGRDFQTDTLLMICATTPIRTTSLPGMTESLGRTQGPGEPFPEKVKADILKGPVGFKAVFRSYRAKLGLGSNDSGNPLQIGLTKAKLGATIGKNKVMVEGGQLVASGNSQIVVKEEFLQLATEIIKTQNSMYHNRINSAQIAAE